jgi:hypothetical protein
MDTGHSLQVTDGFVTVRSTIRGERATGQSKSLVYLQKQSGIFAGLKKGLGAFAGTAQRVLCTKMPDRRHVKVCEDFVS